MLKKLLLSLILQLIFTMTAVFAAPIDVESGDSDFDEISVVTSLGIMDLDDESAFRSDDNLTRAELARIAIVLNGLNVSEVSANELYDDVEENNRYGKYIFACKEFNLMNGVQDRMFDPEGFVTREQLNAVVIRILGCEEFAKIMGGYPTGYTNVANHLGINSYLRYDGEFVTRRSAAIYLYNVLDVPMPKLSYNNVNGIEFSHEGSSTLAETLMNIRKLEGLITGNEISALPQGNVTQEGFVEIAGEIVNAGSADIMSKLGRHAEVYVSLDKEKNPDSVISYILPKKQNNEINIKAKDIYHASTNINEISVIYENKSKTYRLDGNKTVIKNGEVITSYSDDIFRIRRGELTMVDTDNKGKYDLVIIEEPISVVFNRYSADTGVMSFKYGVLPLDIKSDAKIEVYIDDVKSDAASLKEWMSLFIYKPENSEYYIIKASSKNVKGKLSYLSGDGTTIKVDGVEYPLSYDYDAYCSEFGLVEFGNTYTFILTPYGEVVGIMKASSSRTYKYAYLLGGYTETLPEEAYIGMFTEDAEYVKLKVRNKFKFDNGTTATTEKAKDIKNVTFGLFDAEGEVLNQLICYKLDTNGDISEIKIAKNMIGETPDDDVFSKDYVQDNTSVTIRYNTFEKMYHLAEDIVIFRIPGKLEGGVMYPADDLTDIRIEPSTKFSGGSSSANNFELYDVDSFRRAKAMVQYVVKGSQAASIKDTELILVSDTELALLPNGDTGYIIRGYQDGKAVELTAEPDITSIEYSGGQWREYENTSISEIKAGNLIQVVSLNGKIDEFLLLGDLALVDFDHERVSNATITTAASTKDTRLVTVPGKVVNVDGTYVLVSTRAGNGESCERIYNVVSSTEVYIYDSVTGNVTLADFNSIVPDDKVFIRTFDMQTRTVILVR